MKGLTRRQVSALVFGVFTLLVCASYLARTRLIMGGTVQTELTRLAQSKRMDLEVATIRPDGLWGISLIDVSVRVARKDAAVEAVVDRVDFTPSLLGLLQGKVEISLVEVTGATVALVPFKSSPPPAPVAKPQTKTGKPAPKGQKKKSVRSFDFKLTDINILGPVPTKAPLHLKRLTGELSGKTLKQISGFGRLPDGQDYWLKSSIDEQNHTEIRIEGLEPAHLDNWFERSPPIGLSLNALVVCPECETVVRAEGVELTPVGWREDIRLSTPSATVKRNGGSIVLDALEMQLDRAQHLGFGARLARNQISYDLTRRVFEGRVQLAEETGGTMDVDWTLDDSFQVSVWAEEFHLSKIWTFFQLDLPLQPGRMSGSFGLVADLDTGITEIETALTLRELEINLSKISKEPLVFPSIKLTTHGLIDIGGRAASVSNARVELGSSAPVELTGQIVGAKSGFSFFGNAKAPSLNALSFRDSLPPSLTHIVQGTILDGAFGFDLTIGGHSEFAESLFLDGKIHGDVTVQLDSANADVMSLNTNGPPPMLTQARLETWRSYDSLPPLVPRVMLAAEDAGFFGHPGFDWEGFKRAMIHNLEAGALKRGGSTISQQVVKNLFLSHDRTLARKLQEAYLTWRMERIVPKERILEIYINIVEWGGGAVGIARAAKRYFDADPSELKTAELAMLAAILPNPRRFGGMIKIGKIHSSRLHKVERILKNLSFMGVISYPEARTALNEVARGKIGALTLEICDDDGTTDTAPCVP